MASSKASAPAPADNPKESDIKRDDNDPVLIERGKSRGGARGGKPSQSGTGSSLSGLASRPPGLDSLIEQCDGKWEVTKDMLGALIQRPKLSEKLLSKPPFRFLHDIFIEVINATGFGANLYTPDEQDSTKVTEKTQKIQVLEKMTRLVGVQLGTIVEANPGRIVAGLEPEKTNIFLQLLAVAAKNMPDSTGAVNQVLEQMKSPSAATAAGGSAAAPSKPKVEEKKDEDKPPVREERQKVEERPKAEEKPKAKQVSYLIISYI